jgi:CubicO group peptidase (beta-lactamase class C family)
MSDVSHQVQGSVAPGFEPVRDAFASDANEVGAGGAAFAAMVAGELVVDLWAGHAGVELWRAETRAVIMSATKGIATVGVARLVDRGEIDVEAPMAKYWPEFAAGGKAEVTVAQVLSHSAGLISVPGYDDLIKPDGEGWDQTDEIVHRLASAVPEWPPGTAIGYHGITIGWLKGELVRRVSGKSLGTLVREEVAGPLGLELDIGTPLDRQDLVAPVGTFDRDAADKRKVLSPDPSTPAYRMIFMVNGRTAPDDGDAFWREPSRLASELPAANGTATARALAILYGALANSGRHKELQLLSPATIETFATERMRGIDLVQGAYRRRGLGFQLAIPLEGNSFNWGPHEQSFGHNGAGGQIGFADPVSKAGIGFVRSYRTNSSPLGPRLVDSFYRCLGDR